MGSLSFRLQFGDALGMVNLGMFFRAGRNRNLVAIFQIRKSYKT
jgi:hypothetical protein